MSNEWRDDYEDDEPFEEYEHEAWPVSGVRDGDVCGRRDVPELRPLAVDSILSFSVLEFQGQGHDAIVF